MKKILYKLLLLVTLVAVFASCVSRKDLVYFQGIDQVTEDVTYKNNEVIKVNDLLEITVISENMAAAKPYNNFVLEASLEEKGTSTLSKPQYLVNNEGMINFPQLGKLKVSGKSLSELETYLQDLLVKYVTDVTVDARLLNFKLTFLGEVGSPGTINIPEGKVNILQGLGLVGDVSFTGKRDNVLLIRSSNGLQKTYRVDLTQPDLFKSDYFYLQQNDVIVVEPNGVKVFSQGGFREYLQLFTVIVSLGLSIYIILSR
jgi:polysaccharide export outer membrane protein